MTFIMLLGRMFEQTGVNKIVLMMIKNSIFDSELIKAREMNLKESYTINCLIPKNTYQLFIRTGYLYMILGALEDSEVLVYP